MKNPARWLMLPFFVLGLATGLAAAGPPLGQGQVEALSLKTRPVQLTREGQVEQVGRLRFLGALVIESDNRRFGGLSALLWEGECQRLLAISDNGNWVVMEPVERDEQLVGLKQAWIAPILQADGRPPKSKNEADAESLSRSGADVLVWFEQDHRAQRYQKLSGCDPRSLDQSPAMVDRPAEIRDWPRNSGVEAAAGRGEGQLVIAEGMSGDGAAQALLLHQDKAAERFQWEPPAGLQTTAMDALNPGTDDGVMLVLSRRMSLLTGANAAVTELRLPRAGDAKGQPDESVVAQSRPVASFKPPIMIDNMEGLAVRTEGQRRFVYLVSDDNFFAFQQTLLLKFELLP